MVYGIILAAGSGTRMKMKTKKQFLMIDNKPLFYYSLDKFIRIKAIDSIILVINEVDEKNKMIKNLRNDYKKYFDNGKISMVYGGEERYNSVYNALNYIRNNYEIDKNDKVLIHDSARLFVKVEDIKKLIKKLECVNVVSLASPTYDTVKVIDKENSDMQQHLQDKLKQVVRTLDRKELYNIFTPQGFALNLIIECYDRFMNGIDSDKQGLRITDDLQLIEYFSNEKVYLMDSYKYNIKITTKEDLEMTKILLVN